MSTQREPAILERSDIETQVVGVGKPSRERDSFACGRTASPAPEALADDARGTARDGPAVGDRNLKSQSLLDVPLQARACYGIFFL